MSNRYLEKLAGAGSSLLGAALQLGKNVVGGIGKQFHYAAGGAYRDYAMNTLNIKDPQKLMKFTSSKGSLHIVREMKRRGLNPMSTTVGTKYDPISPGRMGITKLNQPTRDLLNNLKNKTNAARIASGGIIAGGVYAGNKLYQRLGKQDSPDYNQYYQ
jgi:hypothetical protein